MESPAPAVPGYVPPVKGICIVPQGTEEGTELELDPARVRVIQPLVGGAFGGKSEPFDLEFCVAKLAMRTGRPVKILYTREEVFYSHRGRHPFHMRYRTGCTDEGELRSVDAQIVLDSYNFV